MEIILNGKYKLETIVSSMSFSESIDSIAYNLSISLVGRGFTIYKGDRIIVKDIAFGTNKEITIFNGVVWSVDKSHKNKTVNLECKERTIYMEISEDEYLFSKGTASSRLKKYCSDWGIPVGNIEDTKITLSEAIYRKSTILSMIQKDLKETAQKGGELFKLRMNNSLDLIRIGSNSDVWILDTIIEDINEKSSLDGAITRVKVLGKNENDKGNSPIIGTFSKNTEKYGTLQKIVQDENIKNHSQAKAFSDNLFSTGDESINVVCVQDINTLRAGDKISLNSKEYIIIDITHNKNSTMSLQLGTIDTIRRRFFNEYI